MKQNSPSRRRTLNADQLVEATGIGRDQIYRLLKSGELPSIRSGRRFLVPDTVFDEWLHSCGGTIRHDDTRMKELVEA